jgi:maltose O-acetyltransferase
MEKTEKQKMLAGELYLASDPELVVENKRACRLLRKYSATTEEQQEQRYTGKCCCCRKFLSNNSASI